MSTFQDGYKFFAKNAGAMGASIQGGDYIQSIEQEISKLTQKMNAELSGSHATVDTAKGFAAEHWHAGTFNAAKLFQIDLEAFQKITTTYTEAVEKLCSAKNESELNHMLRKAYEILDLGFPWHGDFDTFMQGGDHLVFE